MYRADDFFVDARIGAALLRFLNSLHRTSVGFPRLPIRLPIALCRPEIQRPR